MLIDINKYPKRLKQLRKIYENGSTHVFQRVILESLTQIILRTPVDTGAARANWMVNVGDQGNTSPDTQAKDKTGASSIGKGQSTVLSNPQSGVFVITNALPYIGELNKGSSPQAPSGFVDLSVEKAANRVIRSSRNF